VTCRGATDDLAFSIKAELAADESVRADLGDHRNDALRATLWEITCGPAHVEVHSCAHNAFWCLIFLPSSLPESSPRLLIKVRDVRRLEALAFVL